MWINIYLYLSVFICIYLYVQSMKKKRENRCVKHTTINRWHNILSERSRHMSSMTVPRSCKTVAGQSKPLALPSSSLEDKRGGTTICVLNANVVLPEVPAADRSVGRAGDKAGLRCQEYDCLRRPWRGSWPWWCSAKANPWTSLHLELSRKFNAVAPHARILR